MSLMIYQKKKKKLHVIIAYYTLNLFYCTQILSNEEMTCLIESNFVIL